MLISTKGRYATRMLLDIAIHQGDGYVPILPKAGRMGAFLQQAAVGIPRSHRKRGMSAA